jgi:hypothetical protein
MQFIFGFVVGALAGGTLIRDDDSLINSGNAPFFSVGAGLLVAAVASRYGDKFWLGTSYRVIPPDEPGQSKASFSASVVAGTLGGLLVLLAFARTFEWVY